MTDHDAPATRTNPPSHEDVMRQIKTQVELLENEDDYQRHALRLLLAELRYATVAKGGE